MIESILSDRLLSNAVGTKELRGKTDRIVKTSFSELIKMFQKYAKQSDDKLAAELAVALDSWRDRRNRLVHAAVKSYPTTPPKLRPPEFWNEAARVAQEGVSLSRRLLRWYRSRLPISSLVQREPNWNESKADGGLLGTSAELTLTASGQLTSSAQLHFANLAVGRAHRVRQLQVVRRRLKPTTPS